MDRYEIYEDYVPAAPTAPTTDEMAIVIAGAMSALQDSQIRYDRAVGCAQRAAGWDVLHHWDAAIAAARSARRQSRIAGLDSISKAWLSEVRCSVLARAAAAAAWAAERAAYHSGSAHLG